MKYHNRVQGFVIEDGKRQVRPCDRPSQRLTGFAAAAEPKGRDDVNG